MKSRRSKPEQRSDARHDLKAIQEALRKPLLRDGPFDYSIRAQQVQEARHWNSLASQLRFRPPPDPKIWDIHQATAKRFWEAIESAYPPGFWEDYEHLRLGDSAGMESAVLFLEADPWFFRSGYIKSKLIRYIKRPMLTPEYVRRLQQVVLAVVDKRDDRDFRAYCRLARKVDSPELREQLLWRLAHDDPNVLRRARWVLEALGQKSIQDNPV